MSRIEKALLFLFLLAAMGLGVARLTSWDLFWQMQSGRYVLAHGHFIHHDLFSLAGNAPRYEHCWLNDVLFFLVYRLAGFAGLSVLKGLLAFSTGLVLVTVARLRGASYSAILLLTVPIFLVTGGAWHARPQIWSFFLFALFLLLWSGYQRYGGHLVWFLLPLMLLWANLHAAAILAFPLALAWVVGDGVDRLLERSPLSKEAYRRLCLVALLLPLLSLVTPYGMDILRTFVAAPSFGKSSGLLGQIYNIDWRTMTFARTPQYFYLLGAAVLLMLAGWRRLLVADLLLLGGLAFMGLRLERHGPYFLLAMAALIPVYLDAATAPLAARFGQRLRLWGRGAVMIAAIALMVYSARPLYRLRGFWNTGLESARYPQAAATFVHENKLPATLFNSYEWGGYLMWRLYPTYRVFWDGREDSRSTFRQGLAVMWGEHWQEIFARNQVNTVVLMALSDDDGGHYPILDLLRASPAWTLVYSDVSALVFVRRDAEGKKWLAQHELPKSRIDDTLLSYARVITRRYPWRYKAWWEMARIDMKQGRYRQSFAALVQYLRRTPAVKRVPEAMVYYRVLYPLMREQ